VVVVGAVRTVLVVDAVAAFREALSEALRYHGGYAVLGDAASAPDAIRMARTIRPGIVIVDLDLPLLAGSDLVERLRDAAPGVQIVISSRAERSSVEVGSEPEAIARLLDLLDELGAEGLPTVVIDLPNEPASVARSRRFVESWCDAWGEPQVIEAALLVVSELVTNAITHGGGICELRLRRNPDALRIEVVDAGNGSPSITDPDEVDEGGRGLRIVTFTCRAWGVEDDLSDRKVVWAELPLVVR
jgi:CheY-like chemotaxis protein